MQIIHRFPLAVLVLLFALCPLLAQPETEEKDPKKPTEPKPPTAIGGKSLDRWIAEITNRDPGVRVKAIQIVPAFLKNSAKAVPALMGRTHDKDVSVRSNAVLALGAVHVTDSQIPRVVLELADRLGPKENQAIVRLYAAQVLSRFGPHTKTVLTRLAAAAIDKRSWEIRRAGVIAIAGATEEMEPEQFGKALKALLAKMVPAEPGKRAPVGADSSEQVRLAAVMGLVEVGKEGTAEQRTQLLEELKARLTDKSPVVAIWAHVAVMKLEEVNPDYLKSLAKYLESEELVARSHVLRAFAALGEQAEPQVPNLRKLLMDKEPIIVGLAAWSLGEIGLKAKLSPEIADQLEMLSKDKKVSIGTRHEALLAAAKIRKQKSPDKDEGESVTKLWKEFLKDFKAATPDGKLNTLGGKQMERWLAEIKQFDPSVRENAVRTIPYFKSDSRDAVPALIWLMERDPDVSLKVNLARVFSSIEIRNRDVEDVVECLRIRMRQEDQSIVRYQIAQSLGRFQELAAPAIPEMVHACRDVGSWEIRYAAIQSLRNIVRTMEGDPDIRAVRAFMNGLRDHSAEVRLASVGALGALRYPKDDPAGVGKQVVNAVLQMKTNESNEKVAIWAHLSYMALSEVSDKEMDSLARFLKSKKVDVRATAIQALGVMKEHAKDKIPDLVEALKDTEPEVVLMAAWAVGEMSLKIGPGKEATSILMKITKDEKTLKPVKEAAETALKKIRGEWKPEKK